MREISTYGISHPHTHLHEYPTMHCHCFYIVQTCCFSVVFFIFILRFVNYTHVRRERTRDRSQIQVWFWFIRSCRGNEIKRCRRSRRPQEPGDARRVGVHGESPQRDREQHRRRRRPGHRRRRPRDRHREQRRYERRSTILKNTRSVCVCDVPRGCFRDSQSVGFQTEGFARGQHGARGGRSQEGLLDRCFW